MSSGYKYCGKKGKKIKCEALGRDGFKQDVGKAPLRCHLNVVMKEGRESALSGP